MEQLEASPSLDRRGQPGTTMRISILDDYHDTLRTLPCFQKLAGQQVTVWNDRARNVETLAERSALPGMAVTSPASFGRITGPLNRGYGTGTARQIQFMFRYNF